MEISYHISVMEKEQDQKNQKNSSTNTMDDKDIDNKNASNHHNKENNIENESVSNIDTKEKEITPEEKDKRIRGEVGKNFCRNGKSKKTF